MKSTIFHSKKEEPEFPLLALNVEKDKSFIVLFSENHVGTVVWNKNTSLYDIGFWSQTWHDVKDERVWEILPKGQQIILEN